MTLPDLSRIDRTIEIKAPPERVWRALTTAAELSAWFQVKIEGETLEAAEGGTRLSVSETGFDAISLARRAKVHGDNSQGWPEVLVWLQTYVEKAS
jgi:uncharacterized protein YndB with AHSA1/START domain